MNGPSLKMTLIHQNGASSRYLAGAQCNSREHGALREAVVTCIGRLAGYERGVELLRADIPGADFAALDAGGPFVMEELTERLTTCATDLADGHDPHVVVTLNAQRGLESARLVTSAAQVEAELKDPSKRSLVVPKLLPYQVGGSAEGATAVIYSPAAGGGMKLHSMHPTASEAAVAEAALKSKGETKTGTLQVHTAVTELLAAVASNALKAAPAAHAKSQPEANAPAPARQTAPSAASPFAPSAMKPSPFGSMAG